MTLFEAQTGGAFDRLNWQHSGEFGRNLATWAVLELTGTLEQLASPNLDSDSQESVFDRAETLYNTVVNVRWGIVIML